MKTKTKKPSNSPQHSGKEPAGPVEPLLLDRLQTMKMLHAITGTYHPMPRPGRKLLICLPTLPSSPIRHIEVNRTGGISRSSSLTIFRTEFKSNPLQPKPI